MTDPTIPAPEVTRVSLSLASTALTLAPGAEGVVLVTVSNVGSVVDRFQLEVLGDPAAWAVVEPASVSLFPGAQETVRAVFRPPRQASVVAGPHPFAVKAAPEDDPDASITEEGSVEILPFSSIVMDVAPRTSRGRRRMAHEISVRNDGNITSEVVLEALDVDEQLDLAVEPDRLAVAPGAASFAKLRVKPMTRNGSGPPRPLPFVVRVSDPEGATVAEAPVMAVQEAMRPRWLLPALIAACAILLVLALLWFTALKPVVKSTAREAVLDSPSSTTPGPTHTIGTNPEAPVTTAAGKAGAAAKPGSGGGGSGSGGGGSSGDSTGTGPGSAIAGRLSLTAAGATSYTVPGGLTVQITDIVLQNPGGDAGLLRVKRNEGVLLVVELAHFRDLDYHFVAPIVLAAGEKLVLEAACSSPTCTPGAYFAGFVSS